MRLPSTTSAAAEAEHDRGRDRREHVDRREVDAVEDDRLVVRARGSASLTPRNVVWLVGSRVNDWTTRMPEMSSASVAVTSPSRSRTRRYARFERTRNQAVAAAMSGRTRSVASASRQSRRKSTTAVPTRRSVFWTRLETPSVTSWSSASTSFVIRLTIAPVRLRS